MALTKVTYSMIKGAPFNVLDYGAVGNGSNDDTAGIRAAVAAGQATGNPFTLVFPSGYTFLIADPIRITANDVLLTGGGTLHTRSSSFTTVTVIPGYSLDVRAGFIFWNGNPVRATSLSSPTYDFEMQSGIVVDNLTFYDDYNQTSTPLSVFSCAIVAAYCINMSITNSTFYGYKGEIIKGVLKNFNICHNSFRNSSVQAISIFDYNGVVDSNNCYQLGEFYEGSGDRIIISNNMGDYCGDPVGVVPSSYIISLSGRAGQITQAVISNNAFANCNVTQGVTLAAVSSNCVVDAQIIGNYFQGNLKDQGFIYVFSAASDSGSVIVADNVCIEDASNPYTSGGIIVFDQGFASSVTPAYICENNQVVIQSTGKIRTAISTVNIQNGIIRNNVVKLLGTLWPGVSGYAHGQNTIWLSTTASNSAFGYPNLVVENNYVNGTICTDDTIRVSAVETGNILNTRGRKFVQMTNAGAVAVSEVKASIGEEITIHVTAGTVTFNFGTYFRTSTGSSETVAAGQIYRFVVFAFDTGTTSRVYCKALGAPITI